jgi:2-C-methyl-D-erythritol 4-phosphate cytidylyltransferase
MEAKKSINQSRKPVTAIVLAAGQGKRMNSTVQKQYLQIQGKPVLYYTLKAFEASDEIDAILLVTGEKEIAYCQKEIVDKWQLKKVRKILPGGAERYLSVFCGLQALEHSDGYVLIHDGARPFVSSSVIARCVEAVKQYNACVAAMPVKDTIKIADEQKYAVQTPERNTLWMIQTPQAFSIELIKKAYGLMYKDIQIGKTVHITDDAMVLEQYLHKNVKLVEGDYKNIKITTPEDLVIAEAFAKVL